MIDQGHMARRAAAKAEAVADLEFAIAVIENERREPDNWEQGCLLEGISDVFRGLYGLAHIAVGDALTPAVQRGMDSPLSLQDGPFTVKRLRRMLRIVETEPVQAYQHFGPIICADSPR